MSLGIAGIAVLALLFGGYGFYALHKDLDAAKDELARTAEADTARITELQSMLDAKSAESSNYLEALEAEQRKNGTFENQIRTISGTVGTLQKLATTDSELLAKYSKVYFLNENYAPAKLSNIDARYVYEDGKQLEIQSDVAPFLEDLLAGAKDDGVDLLVASAYRSFTRQAALKTSYRVTYGTGANAFSADQGYSEHQLGTTVDFTTSAIGGGLVGFDKTEAFAWLNDHAYRYGFILSYPKTNTFYQYEPWHWRFVGRDLARRLHEDGKHFYDLDQRDIDQYLVSLFD
jgi:LAS superfamily LD-carboxypeptidase LdcB